jgi:hypothetical protein
MPQATLPQINKSLEVAELERICSLPGPCITILLPAYRPGAASSPEAVPLKHLLRAAAEQPAIKRMAQHASPLLEPLRELADTPELESGGMGLALFSAPGFAAGYRNGSQAGPKLEAGQHPFIRPLLTYAFAPGEVFALALSRKHPRLLRCRHSAAEEIALPPGVPKSLAEAGEFDQPDHDLANRSASGTSTGSRFAVRFGTLSDRESAPEYLHDYFALMDRGLHPLVKDTPVFLMGVAEEIAAFRKAARHLKILETQFAGSAEFAAAEEIAGKARESALESYRRRGEDALRELREMPDRNRVCIGLAPVLAAAEHGRVHQLLLAEETEIPAKHRKDLMEGEDVLNAIAVETIRLSGQVFTLPAEAMGDAAPVAAILRY